MTADKRLFGAIHSRRKQVAGLADDDTWRAFLGQVAGGVTSLRAMTGHQLGLVLDELVKRGAPKVLVPKAAGKTRLAGGEQVMKIRALWLALHHLAVIRNPSEQALAGFAKRVAHVDALEWLTPQGANKVIEGLKARCVRAGFEPLMTEEDGGLAARHALCRAIWSKLGEAGALRVPHENALHEWGSRIAGRKCGIEQLSAAELDRLIGQLGGKLRKTLAGRAAADEAPARESGAP